MTTTQPERATVASERLARVAAAEAELAGLRAERDTLREQNETLLAENEALSRNLDEAEQLADGRWFTAADAEPTDVEPNWVLLAVTRGITFRRRGDGWWTTPWLSHTIYAFGDMVGEHGPLLLLDDGNLPRAVDDELERRRAGERRIQQALWDAERVLRVRARPMGQQTTGALAELHTQVESLVRTGHLGDGPVDWTEQTVKVIAELTQASIALHDLKRLAEKLARSSADGAS